MKAEFILYSTEGCHLCEIAYEVLINSGISRESIQTLDIIGDEVLLNKYKESIPVVMNKESHVRLFWPFNRQDVEGIL